MTSVRCPFCQYDLTGLPRDLACPECGKDHGDRYEMTRPIDTDLKVMCIVYGLLWIPIAAAIPFSVATFAVAHFVYGIDMFLASQPGAGPYPWIDALGAIATACALYCIALWLASWIAGPIIVGLRIRRRLQGIKTPEAFWLLVFGPLLACPLAYIVSVVFLSGH